MGSEHKTRGIMKSMALIHEKLYQSPNLAPNFKEYKNYHGF